MSDDDETERRALKSAGRSLLDSLAMYGFPEWLTAIGVSDINIIVYIVGPTPPACLPQKWEGYDVVWRVSGRMELL